MSVHLRMPAVFGPAGSPRHCPVDHVRFDPADSHRRLTAYVAFRTTADALRPILPSGLEPAVESPVVSFEFVYMTEIQWLAGRGYNMLQVKVPVRTVTGAGLPPTTGWFQPVIWENMCEPILSGREELGWAKIYADLPAPRRVGERWTFTALWDGFEFMRLELDGLQATEDAPTKLMPLLHHKYIPATGRPGEADADYLTVTPTGGPAPRLLEHHRADTAGLTICRARWEDMPTQFHIVNALADIPRLETMRAGLFRSQGGGDLSNQCRIDSLP